MKKPQAPVATLDCNRRLSDAVSFTKLASWVNILLNNHNGTNV